MADAPAAAAVESLEDPEPLLPPEPDTAELVVRATHVEAPPIHAAEDGDDEAPRWSPARCAR